MPKSVVVGAQRRCLVGRGASEHGVGRTEAKSGNMMPVATKTLFSARRQAETNRGARDQVPHKVRFKAGVRGATSTQQYANTARWAAEETPGLVTTSSE